MKLREREGDGAGLFLDLDKKGPTKAQLNKITDRIRQNNKRNVSIK